jgi:hypothetical protein
MLTAVMSWNDELGPTNGVTAWNPSVADRPFFYVRLQRRGTHRKLPNRAHKPLAPATREGYFRKRMAAFAGSFS